MIAALLIAVATFASTPEQAALDVFGSHRESVRITHVNRAGDFAAIQTAGGVLDGKRASRPVLLQHFPFGWQAITFVSDECTILRVPEQQRAPLTQTYQLLPMRAGGCRDSFDRGPASDIIAVRGITRGPLVPCIRVSESYALAEWYGAGAGQSFYRKQAGAWKLVTSNEGAMSPEQLENYGVPAADAEALLSLTL
jgi:hypothetical protein